MNCSYIIPSLFLDHVELPKKEISLFVSEASANMFSLGVERNLFDIYGYARIAKLSDILQQETLSSLINSVLPNSKGCSIYIEVDILLGKKQTDLFFIKRGIQAYSILMNFFSGNLFFFLVDAKYHIYLTSLLYDLSVRFSSVFLHQELYLDIFP